MRDRQFLSIVKEDKAAFDGRLAQDHLAAEKREALAQLAAKKEIVYRPRMMQVFMMQMRYMDAWGYGVQALGFFGVLAVSRLLQEQGVLTEYQMLGFAALWIIFSIVFLVAGLSAAFTNRMGELEAVCCFNFGQLICVRLIWGGVGHLCALAGFGIFFVRMCGLHAAITGMYLLMVWLLASIVYFFVFAVVRGKGQLPALLASALLLCFCAWLPLMRKELLTGLSMGMCAIAAAVCLLVLIGELVYVFREIEKGELLCFN